MKCCQYSLRNASSIPYKNIKTQNTCHLLRFYENRRLDHLVHSDPRAALFPGNTAKTPNPAPQVPTHIVPVPNTVSPELQKLIAAPADASWKIAITMVKTENMGIVGSSAGGELVLIMVLRAKQERLQLHGSVAC